MNDSYPLFTNDWAIQFCEQWQHLSAARNAFKGVGPVKFCRIDAASSIELILIWDGNGSASVSTHAIDAPCFIGSSKSWEDFIFGSASPVEAVLRRTLTYRGPIVFALTYGPRFSHVRDLARELGPFPSVND